MQWDPGLNAGFTTGVPWLPIADDYTRVNVTVEQQDPSSILMLYHRLISLRKAEPALSVGSYIPLNAEGDLIAYIRQDASSRFLIALNLSHREEKLPLEALRGHMMLSTHLDGENEPVEEALTLRGDEGVIIKVA
jgi:alpha-glucosidase